MSRSAAKLLTLCIMRRIVGQIIRPVDPPHSHFQGQNAGSNPAGDATSVRFPPSTTFVRFAPVGDATPESWPSITPNCVKAMHVTAVQFLRLSVGALRGKARAEVAAARVASPRGRCASNWRMAARSSTSSRTAGGRQPSTVASVRRPRRRRPQIERARTVDRGVEPLRRRTGCRRHVREAADRRAGTAALRRASWCGPSRCCAG